MHAAPLKASEAEAFASLCTTAYQNHLIRQRSSHFATISLGRHSAGRTELIDAVEAQLGVAPTRCAIRDPHRVAEVEFEEEEDVLRLVEPGILRVRGRPLPVRLGHVPLVTWKAEGFPGWVKDEEVTVLLESLVPQGPSLWNIRRMHYVTEKGATVALDSFLFEVLAGTFPINAFYICGHRIQIKPLSEFLGMEILAGHRDNTDREYFQVRMRMWRRRGEGSTIIPRKGNAPHRIQPENRGMDRSLGWVIDRATRRSRRRGVLLGISPRPRASRRVISI
jgi:hypothetical protein